MVSRRAAGGLEAGSRWCRGSTRSPVTRRAAGGLEAGSSACMLTHLLTFWWILVWRVVRVIESKRGTVVGSSTMGREPTACFCGSCDGMYVPPPTVCWSDKLRRKARYLSPCLAAGVTNWRKLCTCAALCAAFCRCVPIFAVLCSGLRSSCRSMPSCAAPKKLPESRRRGNRGKRRSRNASHNKPAAEVIYWRKPCVLCSDLPSSCRFMPSCAAPKKPAVMCQSLLGVIH